MSRPPLLLVPSAAPGALQRSITAFFPAPKRPKLDHPGSQQSQQQQNAPQQQAQASAVAAEAQRPAAPSATACLSSLPLETYLQLYEALTKGQPLVQRVTHIEEAYFKASDLKLLLDVHGLLPGKTKKDTLERMEGLRLVPASQPHAQQQHAATHHAAGGRDGPGSSAAGGGGGGGSAPGSTAAGMVGGAGPGGAAHVLEANDIVGLGWSFGGAAPSVGAGEPGAACEGFGAGGSGLGELMDFRIPDRVRVAAAAPPPPPLRLPAAPALPRPQRAVSTPAGGATDGGEVQDDGRHQGGWADGVGQGPPRAQAWRQHRDGQQQAPLHAQQRQQQSAPKQQRWQGVAEAQAQAEVEAERGAAAGRAPWGAAPPQQQQRGQGSPHGRVHEVYQEEDEDMTQPPSRDTAADDEEPAGQQGGRAWGQQARGGGGQVGMQHASGRASVPQLQDCHADRRQQQQELEEDGGGEPRGPLAGRQQRGGRNVGAGMGRSGRGGGSGGGGQGGGRRRSDIYFHPGPNRDVLVLGEEQLHCDAEEGEREDGAGQGGARGEEWASEEEERAGEDLDEQAEEGEEGGVPGSQDTRMGVAVLPWLAPQVVTFSQDHEVSREVVISSGQLLGRRVAFLLLEAFTYHDPKRGPEELPPGIYQGRVVEALGDHCLSDICSAHCNGVHSFYFVRIITKLASGRLELKLDLHPRNRAHSFQQMVTSTMQELQDLWVLVGAPEADVAAAMGGVGRARPVLAGRGAGLRGRRR